MAPQSNSTSKAWLWGTAILTGLVMVGLGVYFVHVGLDKSNTVSGIIGIFISIAGLTISVVSTIQGRASLRSTNQGQIRMSQQSGSNSTNIQSGGDMQIGDSNKLGSN
ncbi:hypothetical protein ABTZ93_27435 [Streptomyces sp. NPDC097941]|uniref:hypothetical protein n=1 Tax=Streptomyces sp. NPDC097941 TaxID=3155685 RepID=UPI00332C1763